MATARETILAGPFGNLNGLTGLAHVGTLFRNFCDYAKRFYKYRATRDKESTGEKLLASQHGEVAVVDCSVLRNAFKLMARGDLGLVNETSDAVVSHNPFFATRLYSKCFDADIHGNVRTATGAFADVSRCVFMQHYFTKVNKLFFDPCLLAIYATEESAKSWNMENGKGDYTDILYRTKEDESKLLIRIPKEAPQPYGFVTSFLQVETRDLDKSAYHTAFDTWFKPGWQMKTKSVNELLRAAGIALTWPRIK